MSLISASSTIKINATPAVTLAALSDYTTIRPAILGPQYRDYRVISGGEGDGTVVQWTLQATKKRSRNVVSKVSVNGDTITERDTNSTLVTIYRVSPTDSGSTVSTTTSWNGGTGIKGFFERTFAPGGVRRIQETVLTNLQHRLTTGA